MNLHQIKHAFTFLLLLSVFLVSACTNNANNQSQSKSSQDHSAESVVATINDVVINSDELDKELTRIKQRFYSSKAMPENQIKSLQKEQQNFLRGNFSAVQARLLPKGYPARCLNRLR